MVNVWSEKSILVNCSLVFLLLLSYFVLKLLQDKILSYHTHSAFELPLNSPLFSQLRNHAVCIQALNDATSAPQRV